VRKETLWRWPGFAPALIPQNIVLRVTERCFVAPLPRVRWWAVFMAVVPPKRQSTAGLVMRRGASAALHPAKWAAERSAAAPLHLAMRGRDQSAAAWLQRQMMGLFVPLRGAAAPHHMAMEPEIQLAVASPLRHRMVLLVPRGAAPPLHTTTRSAAPLHTSWKGLRPPLLRPSCW